MEQFDEINMKLELLSKIKVVYRDIFYEGSQFLEDATKNNLENRLNDIVTSENEFAREHESFVNGDVSQLIIGVIGSVKSGKSTFINSLIGDNLLKMDFTPATARITRIQYGDEFEIYSKFKSGRKEKTTPEEFKEICNHGDRITDKDDDLDYFIIYYPEKVFKKFVFIDTPGFSSLYESDDKLTKSWIPKLDLIIWLVAPNRGGLDAEQTAIIDEYKEKRKVAVLNKIDLKVPSAIDDIKNGLQDNFDDVYLYSAKHILAERLEERNFSYEFEQLIKQARTDLADKTDFSLSQDDSILSYNSSSLQSKIMQSTPLKVPGYRNNFTEFIEHLDKIRDSVVEIKSKEMESRLSRRIFIEKQHVELLINRLQTNFRYLENKQTDRKKDILASRKNLRSILKKKYERYRYNLFSEIFEAIFQEIVLQEGNVLRDKIVAFGLKDYPEDGLFDTVVKLVHKSFRDFSTEIFHEIERNIGVELSKYSQIAKEPKLVETMESKLATSVGNSIKVLSDLYEPENDGDLKAQRERLEKYIDWIVPDEEHFELLNRSLESITDFIFEQELNTDNQKMHQINTTILKLKGVKHEITY